MNKTKIEWCDYTWNPITGCKRGCEYCYARRIHERFYKSPFSDIVFHPERLNDPAKVIKPSTIFVGSMSDIQYWSRYYTQSVLDVCDECPQHTFMFLSKNPKSYAGFVWPENTMQGLTINWLDRDTETEINIHKMARLPRPFLSIEPLLGPVCHSPVLWGMEKIIVGAMTGRGATPPKKEWIDSVLRIVSKEKLFLKDNIKKYINAERVQ